MNIDITIVLILSVLFLAALTRATLGFGDALVGMPLLALMVDIKMAAPLMAFLAVIIAISMLIQNWRNVDLKSAWRLILSSLIGIPLGLLLLKNVPEVYVRWLLGVVLVLFGLYNLLQPNLPAVQSRPLAYLMGFLGGILGGAYNTNGPPVIIFGKLSRWSPERFRATLQCYFVPSAIFIFLGHGIGGLWTTQVLHLFIFASPTVLLAFGLGTLLSKRIAQGAFDRFVYFALIIMGLLMFID
jgi:uncharacterized membrane protein YfcA